MRSNVKLAAAALALLAATASACGGSSSSSSSSSAGGGGSSSSSSGGGGTTSGTLKVVSDLPLQGASGAQAKTINQAEAFYLANQGGKAGKYSIKLEAHDDSTAAAAKWDENQCKSNATGYVNDKSVVGVLGTFNSGCAKIELPIANQADLGMISPANTAVGLTHKGLGSEASEPDIYYPTGKHTYARVVASDDFQGAAVAQLMKKLGAKSVYILNDKEAYGAGVANATESASKKLGIKVLGNTGFDPKQPNYTALFNKIKGLKPDAVFLGTIIDNNGSQLVKDKVSVLGPNSAVKLIGPDGMNVNDLPTSKDAGSAAEGMYLTTAGLGFEQLKARGGAAAKFITDYEAKFGKPEVYTVYGAASMQSMLKAIAASDGSRKSVSEQLLKVKVSKDESVLGEAYGFDENGDITLKDMSVFKVTGQAIPFDQVIQVDANLLK